VLAREEFKFGGWVMSWQQSNPVTGDRKDGVLYRAVDPLGGLVGPLSPYIKNPKPTYEAMVGERHLFMEDGSPFGAGMDCGGIREIDGLPADCSQVQRMLQNGSLAVRFGLSKTQQELSRYGFGGVWINERTQPMQTYSDEPPSFTLDVTANPYVMRWVSFNSLSANQGIKVPPPLEFKKRFYQEAIQSFNECIERIFGKDANKVPKQTIDNAPALVTSLNQREVGNVSGAVELAIGASLPRKGKYGTIYIAKEDYYRKDYDNLIFLYGVFAHELANILDHKVNPHVSPDSPKFESNYGNPKDPEDKDTGNVVEECVKIKLLYK
jgi:hypothetical protein